MNTQQVKEVGQRGSGTSKVRLFISLLSRADKKMNVHRCHPRMRHGMDFAKLVCKLLTVFSYISQLCFWCEFIWKLHFAKLWEEVRNGWCNSCCNQSNCNAIEPDSQGQLLKVLARSLLYLTHVDRRTEYRRSHWGNKQYLPTAADSCKR